MKGQSKLTHACVMPLLGGLAIGAAQALGRKPECIVDLKEKNGNVFGGAHSSTLRRYWPRIPYLTLPSKLPDPTMAGYNLSKTCALIAMIKKEYPSIDITTAVPPCGGLSLQSKMHGSEMKINEWMVRTMVAAIRTFEPRLHIMENGINLSTTMGAPLRRRLMHVAEKLGYETTFVKVDTANHGLPQKRRRTFMLCWRDGARLINDPRRGKPQKLADFLGDKTCSGRPHGEDERWDEPYGYSALIRWVECHAWGRAWRLHLGKKWGLNQLATIIINAGHGSALTAWLNSQSLYNTPLGQSATRWLKRIRHAIKCIEAGKGYRIPQIVFPWKIASTCIDSSLRSWVHPGEDRFLYVREVMDLMGLPDDMELALSDGAKFKHVIQNVPTNTAKDVVEAAAKALRSNDLCESGTIQDFSRLEWLKKEENR